MYETFPKKGQTTHKAFGTEKGASFAPDGAQPEYQQVGSSRKYAKKAPKGMMSQYDHKCKSTSFAKGGGMAQVSVTYPRSLKQNGFETKISGLGPARTKTQKEA
jgi:hypothetical protein